MAKKAKAKKKKKRQKRSLDPSLPIYQLKIALDYIHPPIWRRVQVDDCSLDHLHLIIQVCMGWEDCHMHAFDVKGVQYGDSERLGELECRDARDTMLSDLVEQGCDTFQYEYDFGDSWEHTVTIEKTLNPGANIRYPRCLEGKRACPPEDCGGPYRYPYLLDCLEDETDEEHEELLEWVGDTFDPEYFDLDATNEELRSVRPWLGESAGKHGPRPKFAPGDRVRGQAGTAHPEYDDIPLGGWAGEVSKIIHLTPIGYLVRWSEETLQNVHPVYLKRRQRDHKHPQETWLDEDHLQPDSGDPLSIEQPTNIITRPLSPDNQTDRIAELFSLSSDDPLPPVEDETLRQYYEYLKANLTFPFDAFYWPDGPTAGGFALSAKVTGIQDESPIDLNTGIMCRVQEDQGECQVPLHSLIIHEDNPFHQLLDDYSYWCLDAQDESDVEEFDDDEFHEFDEFDDDELDDEWEDALSGPPQYPIGTIALYGPDETTTTKIAAGVILEEDGEALVRRWVGTDVKDNPKVRREIEEFFKSHAIKSVVATDKNIGCPHEEGEDFPVGEDCPFCSFWKGKQGTARREDI